MKPYVKALVDKVRNLVLVEVRVVGEDVFDGFLDLNSDFWRLSDLFWLRRLPWIEAIPDITNSLLCGTKRCYNIEICLI